MTIYLILLAILVAPTALATMLVAFLLARETLRDEPIPYVLVEVDPLDVGDRFRADLEAEHFAAWEAEVTS